MIGQLGPERVNKRKGREGGKRVVGGAEGSGEGAEHERKRRKTNSIGKARILMRWRARMWKMW